MKSHVYFPDVMVLLRYHAHLAELRYGKLPVRALFLRFGGRSGSFGLAIGNLTQPYLAKARMAPLNSPDLLRKRAKNERFRCK